MNNDSFIPSLLTEKIKLSPKFINKSYKQKILSILIEKNEGKCSKHGYIKKNSIKITKISTGIVETHTLHGFVNFMVQFKALVCNPTNGSVLRCKIINSNNFGILCSSGVVDDDDGTYTPIMDIIIPKNSIHIKSDNSVNFDELKQDQVINVEIVGKKYEINDSKISAVGKIVNLNDNKVYVDVENNEEYDNKQIQFEETYEDDFENDVSNANAKDDVSSSNKDEGKEEDLIENDKDEDEEDEDVNTNKEDEDDEDEEIDYEDVEDEDEDDDDNASTKTT